MDRPYLPYIPQITPFVRSPSCEIGSAWSKYRNLLLDVGSDPEESRQTQRMNVLFNKINDPSKAGITSASLLEGLNSLGLHVDLTETDSLLRELLKSSESRSVAREAFYDFMSGLLCGEEQHWDAIPHIEGEVKYLRSKGQSHMRKVMVSKSCKEMSLQRRMPLDRCRKISRSRSRQTK